MDVTIEPGSVSGRVWAPPSKSYSHRAILAAGYADRATIERPLVSADTKATMQAVRQFGGSVDIESESVAVTGFAGQPAVPGDVLDCGNSGTTTRLVTGTAGLVDGTTILTGDRSLRSRPHGPLLDALEQLGATARSTRANGQAPLVIDGPIDGGSVSIPGDVSSQYVTSLLMAGACTEDGITIELTTPLKSAPYVTITRELLAAFGVTTERTDAGFVVPGGQQYSLSDGKYTVPGDFSSASYPLLAGALAGEEPVTVAGCYPGAQGDSAIVDVLDRMGAQINWDRSAGTIEIARSSLTGVEVDVGDTPDLLPTIAVLGAAASGTTTITNCEHVRYKETDRVSAMATELEKLGVEVEETPETLTVYGTEGAFSGATLESYHDHRIIMSLSVAGLLADEPVTITDGEHVDVSYPTFFEALSSLGASVQH